MKGHALFGLGYGIMLVFILAIMPVAAAHELRPALFQVTEHADRRLDIVWKQPTDGMVGVRLAPFINDDLLTKSSPTIETTSDYQIRRWQGLDPGPACLDGCSVCV